MADDPYLILGVARTATGDEIRRAYLKLVKELHPDINPKPAAHERFKKVTAAHDILGDATRRQQFDRGEIDANGEVRRQAHRPHAGAGARGGAGFTGFNSDDVFSDIFGGLRGGRGGNPGPVKGQDARYTLEADFLEAVQGAKKRVTLPGGGVLDIAVPEGVADAQVLRLKGKGAPGQRGGEAGDALVEIKVRPHAVFKRLADDVLIDIPVTIDEAVLGAKIEVPSVSGRLQITVPKATSSGQVLRLKGKGIRNPTTGTTGDQLVTVRIVLPAEIDDGLAYFLTEWRQKNRYDPGRS
ncbi:MAG: J domain-containing protein [Hyphomicrobium sp.]